MKAITNGSINISSHFLDFVTNIYIGMHQKLIMETLLKKSKWQEILPNVAMSRVFDIPIARCIPDYPNTKDAFVLVLALEGENIYASGHPDSTAYVSDITLKNKTTGKEEDAILLNVKLDNIVFPNIDHIHHELHHIMQNVNGEYGKAKNWGLGFKKPKESDGFDINEGIEFYSYLSGYIYKVVINTWDYYLQNRNRKQHGWDFLVSVHKEELTNFTSWLHDKPNLTDRLKKKAIKLVTSESYDQLLLIARRERLAGVPRK